MDVYVAAIVIGLCLSVMALGVFLSIKIFNIPDITTDGSYTLGAVVTAVMLTHHFSIYTTLIAVLLCGAIAGICTAIIYTKLKVDALLAGILVMTALYSVNLLILGRSNLPLLNTKNIFDSISFNSLAICLIIVAIITAQVVYLLKTDFGIAMRATGNNSSMAKALGVNDKKIKIIGLAISNALTAFAGFLITQNQFYADINMGIGIVITGLGSVLIADTFKNLFSTNSLTKQLVLVVIGSIVFQLILAIALSIGANPVLLKLITSVFVLIVIAVSKLKK